MGVETGGIVKEIFLATNCVYICEWWNGADRWNKYPQQLNETKIIERKEEGMARNLYVYDWTVYWNGYNITVRRIYYCSGWPYFSARPCWINSAMQYTHSPSASHLTWIIETNLPRLWPIASAAEAAAAAVCYKFVCNFSRFYYIHICTFWKCMWISY